MSQINLQKKSTFIIPPPGCMAYGFDFLGNPVYVDSEGVSHLFGGGGEISSVNIIASAGVGAEDDLPTPPFQGAVYVSNDTYKVFTAIDSSTWESNPLVLASFVTDSSSSNELYQYLGTLVLVEGRDSTKLNLNQSAKQTLTTSPIFGNLTANRVAVVGTDGSLVDFAELVFDPTNKRIGVRVSPSSPLHVKCSGVTGAGSGVRIEQSTNTNYWEIVPVGGILQFAENGTFRWSMGAAIYSGTTIASAAVVFRTSGAGWIDSGNSFGFGTKTPTKKLHVGGDAGYVSVMDEATTDLDFASRKTAKTFGKQSLITKAPVITVWDSSDYRDGQIKTTKAEYYNETTLYYEQRFDWNEDFSVKRIEIKDDITGLWVQRNYTWTDGIPSVSESTIIAWTI